jgi:hypothetical protein
VTEFVDLPLPAPLADAVAEFEAWMQGEFLADQTRSTPSGALYHYTDIGALRGILENQRLWCFIHSQQSDDRRVPIRPWSHCSSGLDDLLRNNPMGETFDFY